MAEFEDSISWSHGDQSGTTFCGSRILSFSPSDIVTVISPTHWEMSVTSPTYSVGMIPLTITVTVANSATATQDFTLYIVIQHQCQNTVVSSDDVPFSDMEFLVDTSTGGSTVGFS